MLVSPQTKKPFIKSHLLLIGLSLIFTALNTYSHEEGHEEGHASNSEPKLIINQGLYLNTVVGSSQLDNAGLARGRRDPAHSGFSIPSINLSTDISYGEHLAAFAEGIAFWNEDDGWDIELEELYLKGVNLPGGLEIKAGRLLPSIGTRNNSHNHTWNYVDNQLGNVRFLGEAGLIIEGAELSWTPSTPWDDQFYASFGNAIEHDGDENEEAELALWDANIISLRYESTFWPSLQNSYRVGASYLQGDNFFDETARLYGIDLTYTWLQDEDHGRKLIWTNEAMFRDISTDEGQLNELAFSSAADYHINDRWQVGLRYDYVEGVDDPELVERHRISPVATHRLHLGDVESTLRLQYNYDHSEERNTDHSIWFQLGFSWGVWQLRTRAISLYFYKTMYLDVIGHLHTCYGEKFAAPRQPGIVEEAWGELTFEPAFRNIDSLRGLEGFSHLWLIFAFHHNAQSHWKPLVRPPRLGGNEKVGVFASRSPFRPNPIGMSCVKLDSIDLKHPDSPVLKLSGVDLVDGTPILDIKPYLPYSDSLPHALGGFAKQTPSKLKVTWHEASNPQKLPPQLHRLIEATLAADPRPAYQQELEDPERQYGCLIEGYNVRWIVKEKIVIILSIKNPQPNGKPSS